MICVGIDASSEKHDVCITSDTGELFTEVFSIKNNRKDYEKLLSMINSAKEHFNDDKVRLGIESTGSYSAAITDFFANEDSLEVVLINPILTNMYQQLKKVHYAKTDSLDAIGIASFIANKLDVRIYTPPSYHNRALKEMFRELVTINKNLCECKNKLRSTLHRYFPEYLNVFSNISCSASLFILKEYDDLRKFLRNKPTTLLKKINAKSGGKITINKINLLQDSIKNSICDMNNYCAVVIKILAERILLLEKEKEELLIQIEPIVKQEGPELLSIPGISITLAAGIISEIISITNFQCADQLVAYAGLDPIVYESGTYKAKNTRISKKGSSYLREVLYYASFTVSQQNEYMNLYYEKKKAEGKKHRVILGHVAKKLCRLIFSLLSKHQNYISPLSN